MDYSGRNVLVTGGGSGLGLAVSKRLAQRGANTIVMCRSEESGARAARDIEREVPDASVRPMICDLASMGSLDRFIADVTRECTTLDLLFNNAAVMKRSRTLTADGFETMFQVNYLAPFILMTSLLELLRNGTMPLVLNNGRPSAKLRLDFDDLQFASRYRMHDSFFRTKLCLLLSTMELAHRPEGEGVSIHMADPGPFKSRLVREAPGPVGWLKNLVSASVDAAAENIMYVATTDEARSGTGKVFKKRREVACSPYWMDADVRERLWSATAAMIENVKRR